jgi:hypothetical protein
VASATHQFHALDSCHPHLVVCGVPDQRALLDACRALARQGVRTTVFLEPDLGNRPTALAAEPVAGARRRPFRRFRLLRLGPIHQSRAAISSTGEGHPAPGLFQEASAMTVYQSRFGHHPCDYQGFL